MVRLKAISLSRGFRKKSDNAQYHATRRFIRSLGLVYRMATNESQKDPRETKAESLDFLQSSYAPQADPSLADTKPLLLTWTRHRFHLPIIQRIPWKLSEGEQFVLGSPLMTQKGRRLQ